MCTHNIGHIKLKILILCSVHCVGVDFYTAWDVIAKHVLDYSLLPNLAHRYVFLGTNVSSCNFCIEFTTSGS